jgi:hypothetical protein
MSFIESVLKSLWALRCRTEMVIRAQNVRVLMVQYSGALPNTRPGAKHRGNYAEGMRGEYEFPQIVCPPVHEPLTREIKTIVQSISKILFAFFLMLPD